MTSILAAVAAIAAGLVASFAGVVVAVGDSPDLVGPIISGVGNGVAVAALAYVVRAILSGQLVARSSAAVESKLFDLVDTSHDHVELLHAAFKAAGYPAAKPPKNPAPRRKVDDL